MLTRRGTRRGHPVDEPVQMQYTAARLALQATEPRYVPSAVVLACRHGVSLASCKGLRLPESEREGTRMAHTKTIIDWNAEDLYWKNEFRNQP